MDIQEYRTSKLGARVTADIVTRWQSRVITQGLASNRAGAISYLNRYGKSVGASKVIKFAVHAEAMGYKQFASVMWEKAFMLETGNRETFHWPNDDNDAEDVVLDQLPEALPDSFDDGPLLSSFPEHLKPGKVATLQPQDIRGETTEHKWKKILKLTRDPTVWVQEKIDGMRMLAFVSPEGIYYQKRSLRLMEAPTTKLHERLQKIAEKHEVIFDGELTWLDIKQGRHRTASQAATVNEIIRKEGPYYRGHRSAGDRAVYFVFDCLFLDGEDLLSSPYDIRWAKMIEALKADRMSYQHIKPVTCEKGDWVGEAAATRRKRKFFQDTRTKNLEGVVIRYRGSPYRAGKSDVAYRHKWLEERDLVVAELTATTVENRPFGAIVTELGSVGTGFSQEDMKEIDEKFNSGEELKITVRSQGLTETGRLWHARFIRIVE